MTCTSFSMRLSLFSPASSLFSIFARVISLRKQFRRHFSTSAGLLFVTEDVMLKRALDLRRQLRSLSICFWKMWSKKAYESS